MQTYFLAYSVADMLAPKASDPADNPYWKRDVRRAYPRLSVVTQEELATFLLQSPEQPAYVRTTMSIYHHTHAYV